MTCTIYDNENASTECPAYTQAIENDWIKDGELTEKGRKRIPKRLKR
jgi:hypothetical protein